MVYDMVKYEFKLEFETNSNLELLKKVDSATLYIYVFTPMKR